MELTNSDRLLFRPTALYINLSVLEENMRAIKKVAQNTKVMAVVKSNAYGHGLIESSKAFIRGGADYLGVALVEEGIELRKSGIKVPILVFGGLFGDQIEMYIKNDLDCTASSIDKLKAINEVAKNSNVRARVHLKIDTGMGRIGVQHQNCRNFFLAVKDCSHCEIAGVFSHFATADEVDKEFFDTQLHRFKECRKIWKELCPNIKPLFHIANSGAIQRSAESYFDMIRPGLLAYGFKPFPSDLNVTRTYELKSKVVYFKVLQKGDSVSYGQTWIAKKQTRIVTIPVGYGDGFSRSLSHQSEVLIRGKRYPIIGNICMDQIMADIGEDEAFNGDEVVLFGKQGEQHISIEEIARSMDSISYEVLTSINQRVPRIYSS